MTIVRHPDRPSDSNWAILADFATGNAQLKPEHRAWLDQHAVRTLTAPQPGWVLLRGFAGGAGENDADRALSNRRAGEALNCLLMNPLVDPRHIVVADARAGAGAVAGDDSDRWRSVEVRITPEKPAVVQQLAVAPKLVERVLERAWLIDRAADEESGAAESKEPEVDEDGWTIFKRDEREMIEMPSVLRQTHHAYRVVEIRVTQEPVLEEDIPKDRCVVHYVWGVAPTNVRLFDRSEPVRILTLAQARAWMVNPSQFLL